MADKHTHRYERAIIGRKGYTVFKCNLPGCPHYISAKLVKNRISLCNRCGNEFIIDNRAKLLAKPHCVDCIEAKVKQEEIFHDLSKFIEEKGI